MADAPAAETRVAPARRSVTTRILRGAALVGGVTLVVKLVAFAKEVVLASTFGRGDALEAFLIALLFPTLIAGIVGGAFHQAFVPVYMRLRTSDPAAAEALFRRCLGAGTLLLVSIGAALWVGAPWLMQPVAGGYGEAKLQLAVQVLRWLTPLCWLATLPAMLSAALHARERYLVATAAQVALPALTLALLLAFGSDLGVMPLVIGALGGYAAHAIALVLALVQALTREGVGLRPAAASAPVPPGAFGEVVGQWWPAAGGMVFQNAMTLVDQAMAAHLQAGSVAALAYAYRVIALPMGLATLSFGTAILPVLADLAARRAWGGFWTEARRWVRIGLWGSLVPVAVLSVAARPLIEGIYERGSFDGADTAAVADVFASYAGMIPFYVAGIIGVKAITILGMNRVLLQVSVLSLTVNVAGNVVLSRWFGVSGIAMSTVLVYFLSTTLILGALARRYRRDAAAAD